MMFAGGRTIADAATCLPDVGDSRGPRRCAKDDEQTGGMQGRALTDVKRRRRGKSRGGGAEEYEVRAVSRREEGVG